MASLRNWFSAKIDTIKKHLVGEASQFWRLWSVRINAIGLALVSWVWFDPSAVLWLLNIIPDQLREYLPDNIVAAASAVMLFLGIVLRLIRQPKVEEKTHGK